MSDFTKLNADLVLLAEKVDGLVQKVQAMQVAVAAIPVPAPVVDEQPAIDAAAKAIEDIVAKIPS